MSEILKQKAMRWSRRLGLIAWAEKIRAQLLMRRSRRENLRFVAEHGDTPLPPAGIMHDPYGMVDYSWYWESGKKTAAELEKVIVQNSAPNSTRIKVLEWGCGPARVIRHLGTNNLPPNLELSGTDYNHAAVAWCQAHIPAVAFGTNDLAPPLRYEDRSFDFIYCLSVFTHLSETMHHAWFQELLRVLKPGGRILLTLHGDYYRRKLLADELARYDAGEIVVREGFVEGGRLFTAFHGERFVRERLLRSVNILKHERADNQIAPPQDVWLVQKPA